MRRRLILAICTAVLVVPIAASGAGAATFQGALTIAPPVVQADGTVVVNASGTTASQCSPQEYCGYFTMVTTVPAAETCRPEITGSTWVGTDVYDDARGRVPQSFAPTWKEWPSLYAGPKRACLYVSAGSSETFVAEATYEVPGESGPPPTTPGGSSDVVRAPIPRSVGKRSSFPYRLSTANVPSGVDATRFEQLTRIAARRWGLRAVGTTPRAPRSGDGRDTVGFARDVPRRALGVTRIRSVRYYRRDGRGRQRFVFERVLERDLALAYGVPWHAGPGIPPRDRVDLQTVIVHELGHYAGNDHVRNCTNSPMWVGLRPGEWWWSRADWFQAGCRNAPSTPAVATAAAVRDAAVARAATRARGAAPGPPRPLLVQRSVRRVVLD